FRHQCGTATAVIDSQIGPYPIAWIHAGLWNAYGIGWATGTDDRLRVCAGVSHDRFGIARRTAAVDVQDRLECLGTRLGHAGTDVTDIAGGDCVLALPNCGPWAGERPGVVVVAAVGGCFD